MLPQIQIQPFETINQKPELAHFKTISGEAYDDLLRQVALDQGSSLTKTSKGGYALRSSRMTEKRATAINNKVQKLVDEIGDTCQQYRNEQMEQEKEFEEIQAILKSDKRMSKGIQRYLDMTTTG